MQGVTVNLRELRVRTQADAQPDRPGEAETPRPGDVHEILVNALADALVSDYRKTEEAPVASSRKKQYQAPQESA